MNNYLRHLVLTTLLTIFIGCPKDEHVEYTSQFEVYQKGASDVRLHIAVEEYESDWHSKVFIGDSLVTNNLFSADTVITVSNLAPVTDYVFDMKLYNGNEVLDSRQLSMTTRDTSRSVVSWQVFNFPGNLFWFSDVAIVNENDIWGVGYFKVSSSESYNAAHWDGNEWEFFGIYSNTLALHSIQYFNENDIWVTDNSFPIHWDGIEWTLHHLQNMGIHVSVYSTWGTSSSNMYFAGLNGGIVHYGPAQGGQGFVKIESGTDENFINISGYEDLVIANKGSNGIVKLDGLTATTIPHVNDYLNAHKIPEIDNYLLKSSEIDSTSILFTTVSGFYKYNPYNGDIYSPDSIDHDLFYRSGSSGLEDIWWNGFDKIIHYNGVTCRQDVGFYEAVVDYGFRVYSIEVTDEIIAFAGYYVGSGGIGGGGAMIVIGTRN